MGQDVIPDDAEAGNLIQSRDVAWVEAVPSRFAGGSEGHRSPVYQPGVTDHRVSLPAGCRRSILPSLRVVGWGFRPSWNTLG